MDRLRDPGTNQAAILPVPQLSPQAMPTTLADPSASPNLDFNKSGHSELLAPAAQPAVTQSARSDSEAGIPCLSSAPLGSNLARLGDSPEDLSSLTPTADPSIVSYTSRYPTSSSDIDPTGDHTEQTAGLPCSASESSTAPSGPHAITARETRAKRTAVGKSYLYTRSDALTGR